MKMHFCRKCDKTYSPYETGAKGLCPKCYAQQPHRIKAHRVACKKYQASKRGKEIVSKYQKKNRKILAKKQSAYLKKVRKNPEVLKRHADYERYRRNHPEKMILYIRTANRGSLRKAKPLFKKHSFSNGWPDITVGSRMIEIKRGSDYLSPSQVARHE